MAGFKDIWDRKKDGNRRPQRSFLRVAIVSTVVAVLFLLFKKDNLVRWAQGGITIARQNREIRAGEETVRALDSRIQSLRGNRDSLETLAREQFRFAEKGDDIYLIPEK